ncbi:hypothetical protein TNCV_2976971 [Trichonephila clavipes]|nr:hypothetical protein TNCV_2976971 [Trichonephila clavipes]
MSDHQRVYLDDGMRWQIVGRLSTEQSQIPICRDATVSHLSRQLYVATGTLVSRVNVSRRLHEKELVARKPVVCVPPVLRTKESI